MFSVMEITKIKVILGSGRGVHKAVVSVEFNNSLLVRGIRIRSYPHDPDRLLLIYPTRKLPDGSPRVAMHPCNEGGRLKLEEAILSAYERARANPSETTFTLSGGAPKALPVTGVWVYPTSTPDGHVRAKISMELDNEVMLRGMTLRVREDNSLFIHPPEWNFPNGQQQEIFHVTRDQARAWLENEVLGAYEKASEERRRRERRSA
jgi:stage V sporulation protein G